MKKLMTMFVLLAAVCMITSCTNIKPGYEGIKVNSLGSNKGVQEKALTVGMHWYTPGVSKVYTYPTFVQTVDYEPFNVNAKDGSSFTVDPTISLKIVDGKSPDIFSKYRQRDLEKIIQSIILNYVKNDFRIEMNRFTTDSLVSNRESFENAIENRLREELLEEHFILEQMTSGLTYPKAIEQSVEEKVKMEQVRQKTLKEVDIAKANAEKILIGARAKAEANRIISSSMTALIIQDKAIDKWDGKYPQVVGSTPSMLMKL